MYWCSCTPSRTPSQPSGCSGPTAFSCRYDRVVGDALGSCGTLVWSHNPCFLMLIAEQGSSASGAEDVIQVAQGQVQGQPPISPPGRAALLRLWYSWLQAHRPNDCALRPCPTPHPSLSSFPASKRAHRSNGGLEVGSPLVHHQPGGGQVGGSMCFGLQSNRAGLAGPFPCTVPP